MKRPYKVTVETERSQTFESEASAIGFFVKAMNTMPAGAHGTIDFTPPGTKELYPIMNADRLPGRKLLIRVTDPRSYNQLGEKVPT